MKCSIRFGQPWYIGLPTNKFLNKAKKYQNLKLLSAQNTVFRVCVYCVKSHSRIIKDCNEEKPEKILILELKLLKDPKQDFFYDHFFGIQSKTKIGINYIF